MDKYEYSIRELSTIGGKSAVAKTVESLDDGGQEGWELVSVVPLTQHHGEISLFIFKRRIEPK